MHAGIADRRMWAAHLEPIAAAGHRVIAVDLAGFGDAPVAERFAPDTDLLGTLDELGIDRAVLVGVSFGGAIAQRAAVADPDRIAGLVLVSAPTPDDREPSPELAAAWDAEEEALEAGDVDAAVTAVLDDWLLPDAPAALREQVGEMQRRAMTSWRRPTRSPSRIRSRAARTCCARWTSRRSWPSASTTCRTSRPPTEVAAQLRCQAIVIPAARHLAPLETPEAFRGLLLGFLDGGGNCASPRSGTRSTAAAGGVRRADGRAGTGAAGPGRRRVRAGVRARLDRRHAGRRPPLPRGARARPYRPAAPPRGIQLASSLRALGDATTAVALLREERERPSDELDGAVAGFLALALADTGAPREAAAIALEALAAQLPRYQRSLAAYARDL